MLPKFQQLVKPAIILALTFLCAGCAGFKTVQKDISSTTEDGIETRTITTTVSAYTFCSSNSKLTQSKAMQTDKTQGASLGSLEQSSTGTNIVNVIEAMTGLANAIKLP